MLSIYELAALLLTLSALFGWLNHRVLKLPHSIGLLLLGLVASLLLLAVEVTFPQQSLYEELTLALRQVDFTQVVINGMLAFLLFAGALNVDAGALLRRAGPVALLAVPGTLISTAVVGFAFWGVAHLAGVALPLIWALVFGALISPTDPVAVLTMLKGAAVPKQLKTDLEGESLFNDGVGIVLFTALIGIAVGSEHFDLAEATIELLREAGGGLLLGFATGYVAYRAMRAIDDFPVEVLITLALVSGTYALAQRMGLSGPLATVAAGLLIGTRAPKDAMSDRTQTYVSALWTLIDEVLNSVLFLLIGLEVLVLDPAPQNYLLALLAIPIALVARLIAISTPLFIPIKGTFPLRYVPFLAWAGVHGGISVALALALPPSAYKSLILSATYGVVLFSIVIQGSTLGLVARKTLGDEGAGNKPAESG